VALLNKKKLSDMKKISLVFSLEQINALIATMKSEKLHSKIEGITIESTQEDKSFFWVHIYLSKTVWDFDQAAQIIFEITNKINNNV
jgi:hypothetical protein